MNNEEIVVGVSADTRQFDTSMQALRDSTKQFGQVFASTITSSIRSGRGFDDTLRSLGKRLSELALKSALKPLDNLFENVLGSVFGQAGTQGASLLAGGASSLIPFAKGGVVSSATPFNFGSRLGVMGEAGPEAIMPLKRASDGSLGVASPVGNSSGGNIIFNVKANDAASFRKSEGQITAMLARAVARGQRGL